MNIERAKELLSGHIDNPDPELENELATALHLLETNPELQEWMEQQKDMDKMLTEAVSHSPVPPDLEQKLLASVGVARRSRFKRTPLLILAGSIAAIFVVGIVFLKTAPQGEYLIQEVQTALSGTSMDDYERFRDGMAYYISNVYFQLDHETDDINSIESWLDKNNAPVFETIPEKLLALNPIGCKELGWKGRRISLVCFHVGDGDIIHMFILDRESAADTAYPNIASVMKSHDLETGGWLTKDKVYVLVGSNPDVDIAFALS